MIKLEKKNDKANKILSEFKKIDKTLENADLGCTKTDNKTKYDFNRFSLPLKFTEKIHNYEIALAEAINSQKDLKILIKELNNDYGPRNTEKIEEKKRVLESARTLQDARKDIIDSFEEGIFPYRGNVFKTKKESEENEFFKYIEKKSKGINYNLFKKYFDFETAIQLEKNLFEINDKKKNDDFVEKTKNRWSKLKDEIEEMSENEKKK